MNSIAYSLYLPSVNQHVTKNSYFILIISLNCRSRWPRDLRCRSAAARLLGFGFESQRGHGCLSVVNVVCQVQVSETS